MYTSVSSVHLLWLFTFHRFLCFHPGSVPGSSWVPDLFPISLWFDLSCCFYVTSFFLLLVFWIFLLFNLHIKAACLCFCFESFFFMNCDSQWECWGGFSFEIYLFSSLSFKLNTIWTSFERLLSRDGWKSIQANINHHSVSIQHYWSMIHTLIFFNCPPNHQVQTVIITNLRRWLWKPWCKLCRVMQDRRV